MVTETIRAIGTLLAGIGTLLTGVAKLIKKSKEQKNDSQPPSKEK